MARAAILRASEELFVERGVEQVEIDEIATRAGVSVDAFYVFFDSKEAVLRQLVECWVERCTAHFESPTAYPDEFDDPDALLDFMIERNAQIYRFLWDTRQLILLAKGQSWYPILTRPFHEEMLRRCRAWLKHGRGEGLIRADMDVDVAAALMSGAHDWLAQLVFAANTRPPIESWVELAHESFVRAYGTQELVAALERRRRSSRPPAGEMGADDEPVPSSLGRG